MIREIIRPKSNNFTIQIPNEYIGREVEFVMFPVNSSTTTQTQHIPTQSNTITETLFGILKDAKIDQSDYKDYLEKKYL
jgi:hypothetical protein